jgi:hypothetical protein
MMEDKATEKWKKRLKDVGLIVNMGTDNKTTTGTEKRATGQKRESPGTSRSKKGKKK